MTMHPFAMFTLTGTTDYAIRLAAQLGTTLLPVEERTFEDGEHKIRTLVPVEGHDVYVVHSLHGDAAQSVNDKLCRLLFFIATLKDQGAARVTAVLPYLCYARKDRRTQPHDPITARYVAQLFEAVEADRVAAVEVHNVAAFENGFRCVTRHVDTAELFAGHFAPLAKAGPLVAVSPDAGGTKRVELFRQALQNLSGQPVDNAFVEKYRAGGVLSGGKLVGDVEGKTAIILDDLISSGGTLIRAAATCRAAGARRVHCAATHGLFMGGAEALFAATEMDELVVADTVPAAEALLEVARGRMTVLDSTPLLARVIREARALE